MESEDREGWQNFTSVERAMARRMARAAEVPLSTEFTHVDIVAALGEVKRLRTEGVPATFTAIVLAAMARGLAAFPEVAAEVDYDKWEKRIPESPGVGIAVDSPRGLVVAVVPSVTQRTPVQLAQDLDELVAAVRGGSTEPSLFSGGNISITNMGGLPVYGGTPLPMTPQIAILGVSSAWDAAVVVDGEIRVSKLARFTIALDHRALDGMTSGRFLVMHKELVEKPVTLMAGPAAAQLDTTTP